MSSRLESVRTTNTWKSRDEEEAIPIGKAFLWVLALTQLLSMVIKEESNHDQRSEAKNPRVGINVYNLDVA